MTRTSAVSATPLAAVATTSASPGATPVAVPVALTVATSGALLVQVSVAPAIGCPAASAAAAVNTAVAPGTTVALSGETASVATTASGGASPSSLQAPKVLAAGALQSVGLELLRCSDCVAVVRADSFTPMSVDGTPFAAPPTAVNDPPYERNSTTAPAGSTSARPSGSPFWRPTKGRTTTPRASQVAGTIPLSAFVA